MAEYFTPQHPTANIAHRDPFVGERSFRAVDIACQQVLGGGADLNLFDQETVPSGIGLAIVTAENRLSARSNPLVEQSDWCMNNGSTGVRRNNMALGLVAGFEALGAREDALFEGALKDRHRIHAQAIVHHLLHRPKDESSYNQNGRKIGYHGELGEAGAYRLPDNQGIVGVWVGSQVLSHGIAKIYPVTMKETARWLDERARLGHQETGRRIVEEDDFMRGLVSGVTGHMHDIVTAASEGLRRVYGASASMPELFHEQIGPILDAVDKALDS